MWVVFFLPSQMLPNPPHFPKVYELCLILVDNLFIFPKIIFLSVSSNGSLHVAFLLAGF